MMEGTEGTWGSSAEDSEGKPDGAQGLLYTQGQMNEEATDVTSPESQEEEKR